MSVTTTIRRKTEKTLPYEPVSYEASKRYRRREPSIYENPTFTLRWNLFVGAMIALIVLTVLGIAYLATQISLKEYRMQQLEDSMRSLEVQISHAQAENLGARRDVFFDARLKSDLNLEYPQVMRFVHKDQEIVITDAKTLVDALYGFCGSRVEFGGELINF
jgi:hypothetical protein